MVILFGFFLLKIEINMTQIIYILEFIGIISFALSGMIAAKEQGMDPVGLYFIACVTAFGGGTARDVILDNHPVYWIQHQEFPILILILAIIFAYVKPSEKLKEVHFLIPDAIGLGVFSVLGTKLALDYGSTEFIAVLLGVMTGTVGGVMRDALCNEIPHLFRKLQLYATCAFVGCWLYILLLMLTTEAIALWACFVFIAVLRLLAMRFDWRLQKPSS